jgi:hypothetical protein
MTGNMLYFHVSSASKFLPCQLLHRQSNICPISNLEGKCPCQEGEDAVSEVLDNIFNHSTKPGGVLDKFIHGEKPETKSTVVREKEPV